NGIREELNKLIGTWKSPKPFKRIETMYFDRPAAALVMETPDKENSVFRAGLNIPLRDDGADYPSMVIGNFMLGGGFINSRLATRIRQKEGISYGVGSWFFASAL